MVALPAGEFLMGSAEHEAGLKEDDRAWKVEIVPGQGKRRMRIVRRFALGRYPVTFEEYDTFRRVTARKREQDQDDDEAGDHGWARGRRPVVDVSWRDARDYCAWLNRTAGLKGEFGYRLPTEAEWEYACRAGTNTRRWWGDSWDAGMANGDQNFEGGKTSTVGRYPANPWGLYDMIGNVDEWCVDHWADNISELPADGAAFVASGFEEGSDSSSRVLRGGSWFLNPQYLRSAYRSRDRPGYRYFNVGFRVARTLLPPSS